MKQFLKRIYRFFAMLSENARMSILNIANNRLRSFLTILGIMIGVTAVIALITTISAVSTSISDSFTSMGAGQLTLSADRLEVPSFVFQFSIRSASSSGSGEENSITSPVIGWVKRT